MSDAFATYRAKRDRRQAKRRNARRIAKLGTFLADGVAMLGTIALVGALVALAGALAVERDASYALLVTDSAGQGYVMDYALTYDDCVSELGRYALGTATCDMSKG